MKEVFSVGGEPLDALLAQRDLAASAWYSRVHQELERLCPGECIFRLGEDLEDLVEWLKKHEVDREEERLQWMIDFDTDRDEPRIYPEGGWLRFVWRGWKFRTFSFRAAGPEYVDTHTWVACAHVEAASALVDAVGRHTWKPRSRVMVFEDGDWEESPRLEADITGYSWDSVVLPEANKARIRRAAELFFGGEEVYKRLGVPWKLGFLLVGPPGTGKTLTTKVLAGTCGVPFLYVRALRNRRGTEPTARTIREVFQGARERAPCLLCLEDVDALVREDLRSTFLNEMDGLEEDYRGVLTVATTNHPERLDAALLHRPSRFDYRFEFPLPDDRQRRAFVRHWTEKLAELGYLGSTEAGLEEVVRWSRGMSHAYLKRVLVGTAMRMHTLEEHGDAAFLRLVREELADASADRTVAHRSAAIADSVGVGRVGFRLD